MTKRFEICPVSEFPPGERRLVELDGIPIGIFNVDGTFHALQSVCPHQLAPLCEGTLTGTTAAPDVGEYEWEKDGEVIRCPWHGWEFDITTGESVFNPHRTRVRTFETTVEPPDRDRLEVDEYGTALAGDEPPVDTYDVEVEEEMVVVYV